jgi:hypothetical protein
LVAVRSLEASDFGSFAAALTAYIFVVGIARAVCGEVLVVRHSVARATRAEAGATGTALALALVAGSLLVLVGVVASGALRQALVVLGVTMPGLLLQDTLRYVFVARGQPKNALLIDLVWALVLGALLAPVVYRGVDSAGVFVAAWGIAAGVSALVGVALGRVRPVASQIWPWLDDGRQLWPRFGSEFAVTLGAWQLTLLAIGAGLGLTALGSFRAVQVLFGPLHVLNMGTHLAVIPEGTRRRAEGRPVTGIVAVTAVLLGGMALVLALLLMLLPSRWGAAVLGASWTGASALILPFGIFMVSQGIVVAATVGLRILVAADRSLRAAIVTSVLVYGGAVAVSIAGEVQWVAWWLASAGLISAAVWWMVFVSTSAARPALTLGGTP